MHLLHTGTTALASTINYNQQQASLIYLDTIGYSTLTLQPRLMRRAVVARQTDTHIQHDSMTN